VPAAPYTRHLLFAAFTLDMERVAVVLDKVGSNRMIDDAVLMVSWY
jgi:hypothetical protein